MKTAVLFLALFFVLMPCARAEELTDQWVEKGKGSTKYKAREFMNSKKAVLRAEWDTNNDGKPDTFIEYQRGSPYKIRADENYDGIIEHWYLFNNKALLLRESFDSNGDGKPDDICTWPHNGTNFYKELDRNFDGKVDLRNFSLKGKEIRIIKMERGLVMFKIKPDYRPEWVEKDNDFDGIIDEYTNTDSKARTKVGKKMSVGMVPLDSKETKRAYGPLTQKSPIKDLVDSMNEKYRQN